MLLWIRIFPVLDSDQRRHVGEVGIGVLVFSIFFLHNIILVPNSLFSKVVQFFLDSNLRSG